MYIFTQVNKWLLINRKRFTFIFPDVTGVFYQYRMHGATRLHHNKYEHKNEC